MYFLVLTSQKKKRCNLQPESKTEFPLLVRAANRHGFHSRECTNINQILVFESKDKVFLGEH